MVLGYILHKLGTLFHRPHAPTEAEIEDALRLSFFLHVLFLEEKGVFHE